MRRDESAPQIGRVGYFASGFFDGLKRRVMRANVRANADLRVCRSACGVARRAGPPRSVSAERPTPGRDCIVYEIRDILYLMCLPYKFAGVVVHTSVGTIAIKTEPRGKLRAGPRPPATHGPSTHRGVASGRTLAMALRMRDGE